MPPSSDIRFHRPQSHNDHLHLHPHQQPRWWVPPNPELAGLRNIVESMTPFHIDDGLGREFWVPIHRRTPWQEAIEWLEARDAAAQEWPWPKWEDYHVA